MKLKKETIECFLSISRNAFGLGSGDQNRAVADGNIGGRGDRSGAGASLSNDDAMRSQVNDTKRAQVDAGFTIGQGFMATSRHEFNLSRMQRARVSSIYYIRNSMARKIAKTADKRREDPRPFVIRELYKEEGAAAFARTGAIPAKPAAVRPIDEFAGSGNGMDGPYFEACAEFSGTRPPKYSQEGRHMRTYRLVLAVSLLFACSAMADTGRVALRSTELTDGRVQHVYRAATDNRDPDAMYALGRMFAEGAGVGQDSEEALHWYYRAAELGSGEAMNSLGIAFATGQGVAKSDALAFRWFLRAVEKGSGEAMANIAKAYYLGAGRPVDFSAAAKWFHLAAAKGDAGAMNNLALMYDQGLGVEQNHGTAAALIGQSARLGYPLAMMNLGILYANGDTVKRDVLAAFAWMEAALEAGLGGKERDSVAEKLGTLAKQLAPLELARARNLVGEISADVLRHRPPRNTRSDPGVAAPNVL